MNGHFATNHMLQALVVWLLTLWLLTAIAPFNRLDWLLENLLVFIYAGLLVATYRRFAFSNLAFGLFTIFLRLHLVGAHYTYAETPLGAWLQDWLDLSRNHYDRLVHFGFGLLLAYPFHEVLIRAAGVRRSWSYFMVLVSIVGFSGFYEVLEGLVAMIVSPELGTAYLGTQGDEWDAQKDTALAFAGAAITLLIVWRRDRLAPSRQRMGQVPAESGVCLLAEALGGVAIDLDVR